MPRVSVLAAAMLAAACPASAQPSPAMRQACEQDYRRLCATVVPGEGRILKCLTEHDKDLTPGCRSALASRRGDTR
jgi:hypothetical protein